MVIGVVVVVWLAGRFSRKSRVDISLGYKWTRVDTGESVLCVSFSWSRRFYTPPNYTELSSLFKRVHPCVIRAKHAILADVYAFICVETKNTRHIQRCGKCAAVCVSFPFSLCIQQPPIKPIGHGY